MTRRRTRGASLRNDDDRPVPELQLEGLLGPSLPVGKVLERTYALPVYANNERAPAKPAAVQHRSALDLGDVEAGLIARPSPRQQQRFGGLHQEHSAPGLETEALIGAA